MVYPDIYNYDLTSLTRAQEGEASVVESVSKALGSLVSRLGWERVVVVVVSSGGVTGQLVDRLVTGLCVTNLLHSLTAQLGWDTSGVSSAHYLAWSYIQTNELLADIAEQLLGLSLHLVAHTEHEEVNTRLVAGRMMESLGTGLSDNTVRTLRKSSPVSGTVVSQEQDQLDNINTLDYMRLNSLDTEDSEEPLYILNGEWAAGRLVMC